MQCVRALYNMDGHVKERDGHDIAYDPSSSDGSSQMRQLPCIMTKVCLVSPRTRNSQGKLFHESVSGVAGFETKTKAEVTGKPRIKWLTDWPFTITGRDQGQ